MNIGIIGGGSIGLLLSCYLSNNHQITLYVNREAQQQIINKNGIVLKKEEKISTCKVKTKVLDDIYPHDCYIICVKQPHLISIRPFIDRLKRPVIFLQNGMGHVKYAKSLQVDTYVGVVEHGAYRKEDNCVHHLGEGVIKLSTVQEKRSNVNNLVESLHTEEFPFIVESDYELMLKKKLVINAVINPLTAIFNVPNGSIMTNNYLKKLAYQLCEETARTLHLDEVVSWKRVKETAINTRHNTSSMRADLLHGRKTEIEAISGYILEQEQNLPYTNFVYLSVLALEKEGT